MLTTDLTPKLAGRDAAGRRKSGGMPPKRFSRPLALLLCFTLPGGIWMASIWVQHAAPDTTQWQSAREGVLALAPLTVPFTLRIQIFSESCNASKVERTFRSLSEVGYGHLTVDLHIICPPPPPPSEEDSLLLLLEPFRSFRWPHGSLEVFELTAPTLLQGEAGPPPYVFLVSEGDRVSPRFFELLLAVIAKVETQLMFVDQMFGLSLLRGPQSVGRGAVGRVREPSLFLAQQVHASCQLFWGDALAGYQRWANSTAERAEHCGEASWEVRYTSYAEAVGKRNLVLGAVAPPGEALCFRDGEQGREESQLLRHTQVTTLLPAVEAVVASPWLLEEYDGCGRERRQGVLITDTTDAKAALDAVQVNNTLILVTVNAGFQSMLANWLCFIKALDISNVVIVSMDASLSRALVAKGHTVLGISPPSMKGKEDAALNYGTLEYNTFMYERTHTINEIFKLGYHILLVDADAVWLQSPFEFLWMDSADVVGQPERNGGLCGGFLFLKNVPAVLEFWNNVTVRYAAVIASSTNRSLAVQTDEDMERFQKGILHNNEQTILNNFLKASRKIQSSTLDANLFPHGAQYFVKKVPQRLNITPVVVHNNFIVGKAPKIKRFLQAGLWRIDDETLGCLCSPCGASKASH